MRAWRLLVVTAPMAGTAGDERYELSEALVLGG